ncbi:helix-turn-helix domain-containing protein, partial [Sphingomonadaceae bacterium]|nr:helix-turn-helix domain-containing protein [Sphingomonadaceae bacterium]
MAEADNQVEEVLDGELPLEGPGDRLRIAREKAGLTVEQVAAETRIPERHLHTIERGDFEELPGRTYAVGFSRNYARAVNVDETEIADAVRAELGASGHTYQTERADTFEPGDPARVPSRGLAWFGLIAAVLLIAGLFAFYKTTFSPGSGPGSILSDEEAALAAQAEADEATLPTGAGGPAADPS